MRFVGPPSVFFLFCYQSNKQGLAQKWIEMDSPAIYLSFQGISKTIQGPGIQQNQQQRRSARHQQWPTVPKRMMEGGLPGKPSGEWLLCLEP